MNLPIDLSIIITVLLAVLAGLAGLVKMMFMQFEKRLDERWKLVEAARMEAMAQWTQTFNSHIVREEQEFATFRNFEQQFLSFATSLPTMYLRRDEMKDYLVRLDMKFESINDKLTLMNLTDQRHHDDHTPL